MSDSRDDDNVRLFTSPRGLAFSPDQSVVATLESLLAQARRGEILGVAGVVEYPGQWRVVAVGVAQRDCGPYIGWLEILQQEMVHVHMRAGRRGGGGGGGKSDGESSNTPVVPSSNDSSYEDYDEDRWDDER